MTQPPSNLEDLDFTALLGAGSPAVKPAPRSARIEGEGLIGEQSLARNGYHVVVARERGDQRSGGNKVLIVEDDDDTSALAVRALENGGYVTARAASASDVSDCLATLGVPALILLDIELPGLDGFQMLAKFRAHSKLASTPVVMFTARSTREDVVRGLTLGADGYIAKPVSPKTLLEVVGQVLGR